MTYSIWLEPLAKDKTYLQKIIRTLAKQYCSTPFLPHITLYSGVRSIALAKKAVIDCKDTPKFRVARGNLRYSEHMWKTLYFEIMPNAKLATLNRTLKTRLKNHTKYRFRPHVSLIYKKIPPGMKKRLVKEIVLEHAFEFDKISIIKSSGTVRNWATLMRISLK
jgi:2'-5' RNA ligase